MTQADIQTIHLSNKKTVKVHTQLFINNEFVPGRGPLIDTINPANEEVICKVHSADESDVNLAVEAAHHCYSKIWRTVSPSNRSRFLNKLADLMERDKEELAQLEAVDNGKVFTVARDADVDASISCFRYYAGWADKIHGKTIDTTHNKLCYTLHEPLGVVGAVIPWNYPIMMAAWKFAPALAAGNCIVMKSSEVTPLSVLKFAELVKEAQFPPGAINIITGYGHTTGTYLSSHPKISKMAFTGSTATGQKIIESSVSGIKKLQLELGGKSAQIVCADANLKKAAFWASIGVFSNHGQCCSAGTRIFVHESVHDEFLKLFIEETKKIKVGDPFDADTAQGPQINKAHLEKCLKYVELGKKEGAKLVYGGERIGKTGYYFRPTIFTNCHNGMRIMREEIFGPIASIGTFKTIQEAIDLANDSDYGLAGGVYTQNIDVATKLSSEIKAGTIWINCYDIFDDSTPFGGYKQSGFGKELGEYALQEYTQVKVVKLMKAKL
ncbi:aldehyde dehydrogenase domain-containing protein [Sporodiniella umbellata]|nr:aldehyde dehydrogenase domain-containing protein [Sporodiniella umbellata]